MMGYTEHGQRSCWQSRIPQRHHPSIAFLLVDSHRTSALLAFGVFLVAFEKGHLSAALLDYFVVSRSGANVRNNGST
jgi:hypothetical protein